MATVTGSTAIIQSREHVNPLWVASASGRERKDWVVPTDITVPVTLAGCYVRYNWTITCFRSLEPIPEWAKNLALVGSSAVRWETDRTVVRAKELWFYTVFLQASFMSIFGRHAFCIFALIIVPVLAFHVKTALATIARNEMFVNWNDPLLWRVDGSSSALGGKKNAFWRLDFGSEVTEREVQIAAMGDAVWGRYKEMRERTEGSVDVMLYSPAFIKSYDQLRKVVIGVAALTFPYVLIMVITVTALGTYE